MPKCVPIRDMKDTAEFTRTVEEADGPVTVTKNGCDAFVVLQSSDFEAMQQELTKARLMERIMQAENEYVEGRYTDAGDFTHAVRERYGL